MTSKSSEFSNPVSSDPEIARLLMLEKIRLLKGLYDYAQAKDQDEIRFAKDHGLPLRKLFVKQDTLAVRGVDTESILMTPRGERDIPMLSSRLPNTQHSEQRALLFFPINSQKEPDIWVEMIDEHGENINLKVGANSVTHFASDYRYSSTGEVSDYSTIGVDSPQNSDGFAELQAIKEASSPITSDYFERIFRTIMNFKVTAQEENFPVE